MAVDADPRWRQSESGYGCNAARRMDPPPRSPATEADDCFMVRIQGIQPNTSSAVARVVSKTRLGHVAAKAGSPRISSRRAARSPAACRRARVRQDAMGAAASSAIHRCVNAEPMEPLMAKCKVEIANDLSRCLMPLEMDKTLIAVVEMSQTSWLVGGIVPGVERRPLKKLGIDQQALLKLLLRWKSEAEKKGRKIGRIAVAFEAGHDGFWLARWLALQGIEAHVIHASSVMAQPCCARTR